MMEGFCIFNLQGRFLEVNQAYCRMTGYAEDELLNMDISDLEAVETPEKMEAHLKGVMDRGGDRFETRHRRKDGSFLEVEVRVQYSRMEGGRLVAFVQDMAGRKRIEKGMPAAEENQPWFERLFRHNPALMALSSLRDRRFKDINDAFLKKLGYSRSELIGRTSAELGLFVHQGQQDAVAEQIRTNGRIADLDLRVRCKDGALLDGLFSGEVIRSDGQDYFLTFMTDITRRKQAEASLRESGEVLRAVLNAIPVRVFWKDINLVYLGCNAPFARDAGYETPEEVIGKDDRAMVWGELAERYRADDLAVIESGKSRLFFEEPQTRTSGEQIHLLTSKVPLRDAGGRMVGVLGAYVDITELKQTEENMRLYMAMFESSTEAIAISDPEGRLVYVNAAHERLFGRPLESAREMNYRQFYPPESIELLDTVVAPALARGESWEGELDALDASGRVFPLWDRADSIRDSSGNMLYSFGFMHDVTVQRKEAAARDRLQAELTQAQKLESVGRLAGGVAHDFSNTLQTILGYADLALMQIDKAHPLYADIQVIHDAAKRSTGIIRQLLTFARKETIAPMVVDLNDAVEGMLKMLRRLIGENIELTWTPDANLPPVYMDPSQVDQILANLCVNARDAIRDVGKVNIETRLADLDDTYCQGHAGLVPGQYAMLCVSDNGCGMDRDVLEHVFEPFFTTKEEGKGTGLGLPTVYGIVQQNKGHIEIQSDPGKGTAFQIYLPLHKGQIDAIPDRPAAVSRPSAITETVLLVEDHKPALELCRRLLERLGYRVLTAGLPGEAIRVAEGYAGEIHMLMTDVVMPEMNGRDLAETLRKARPSLKCLYMSGYPADVIARQCVLEKGSLLLQKPFAIEKLAAMVRKAMGEG